MNEFSPSEQFLIEKLKRLKALDVDAHVRGELKVRVMREIAGRMTDVLPRTGHPRFAFASALAACVVVLAGAASWASGRSLPNDLLYPIKVAREDIRTVLARDPAKKAMLQTEFAKERVTEVRKLVQENRDPIFVTHALERYEANVKKVKETAVSHASVNAIAANLSETAAALLAEAQKQLEGESDSGARSREMPKRFVEAAQVSVTVLSEVIARLDSAPELP